MKPIGIVALIAAAGTGVFVLIGCAVADCRDYSAQRYQCIQQAMTPVSGAKVDAAGGSASGRMLPSLGVYNACMAAGPWDEAFAARKNCRVNDGVKFAP
jgi:hypothetical protein